MSVAARPRLPWPLLLVAALLLGFLVAPLLTLVGELPRADHSAFTAGETLDALETTLIAATVATAADSLAGIPLGYWLARTRSRARHLVMVAVLLPLAIPPVVGGVVLVLWLGPDGWLGRWLDQAGLDPLGTLAGTVMAQMLVAAPFVVVASRAAFAAVDPAVDEAARSLGCGPARTLVRVLLPAARRGVAAGVLLAWVRCLGEFGATAVVSYHPFTLPVLAYVRLTGEGLDTALPIAALVAGAGAVGAAAMLWLDGRGGTQAAPVRAEPLRVVTARLGWMGAPVEARMARAGAARRLEADIAMRLHAFELDVHIDAPSTSLAVLGPSGAGKSLTLRSIAGVITPDTARIVLDGHVLVDSAARTSVTPERRGLGYVGQRDGLFEHLDVARNIAFAIRGAHGGARRRRVDELVEAMGLESVRQAHPATLSGGERRRVALARALASSPAALLLDEPFAGLDTAVRSELRRLVRTVSARTGVPVILVTHDRDDVLDLAVDVVVLEMGRVVQSGTVEEVLDRPRTVSVARLVGIANVLAVSETHRLDTSRVTARTALGEVAVGGSAAADGKTSLAVPADAIELVAAGSAQVVGVRPAPGGWRVEVDAAAAGPIEALLPRRPGVIPPVVGARCGVRVDGDRCRLVAG